MTYSKVNSWIKKSFDLSKPQLDKLKELKVARIQEKIGHPVTSRPLDRVPIKWSPERMEFIRDFFSTRNYPYRYHDFSSTYKVFNREIQLFAISLDAYIECNGFIPVEDLIYFSSSGPDYTKILKKYRQDCFLLTCKAVVFKHEPTRYENYRLSVKTITNIDDVFPYRFLIFWEEECDDTEFYFKPVITDNKVIEDFKFTLSEFLKDVPARDYSPKLEVLADVSTSKSIIKSKRSRLLFRDYKGRNLENYFSTEFTSAQRAVVPVYPGGYRDTIICSPEDLSTIKYIEKITTDILKDIPDHDYNSCGQEILDRIDSLVRNTPKLATFVCRDIEKEGISKPRYLLKIMLEELSKVNPNLSPYINFYSNFCLDGKFTERGHGLGMANALTTLMQVTLFFTVLRRLSNKGWEVDDLECMIFNDDFLTVLDDDILDEYWNEEKIVFDGLGLLRKESKSFYSQFGAVFCEFYSIIGKEEFNEKRVAYSRAALLVFAFDYIHEAKAFVSSLDNRYTKYLEERMGEIISYWGYEFFPTEFLYPYQFGGWLTNSYLDYNCDITVFEVQSFNIKIYAAWKACKYKRYIRRKNDANKTSCFLNKLIPNDDVLKGKIAIGSDEYLKNHYKYYQISPEIGSLSRYEIARSRKDLYERILREEDISFEKFKKLFYADSLFNLPAKEDLKWIEPDFFCETLGDPYLMKTPLANYLLKRGSDIKWEFSSGSFPEEYSIRVFEHRVKNLDFTREFSTPNFDYSEVPENVGINLDQFIKDDNEIASLGIVIYALQRFHNSYLYPILPNSYRDPKIGDYKSEVYGELLYPRIQVLYSHGDIPIENLRYLIKFKQGLEEVYPDGISADEREELLRLVPEFITKPPEEEESDEDSAPSEFETNEEDILKHLERLKGLRVKNSKLKSFDDLPKTGFYSYVMEDIDFSVYEPRVKSAIEVFRSIFSIFYYGRSNLAELKGNHVSMCTRTIERLDTESREDLYKIANIMILRDGYCKDLSEVFGFDLPIDEEDEECCFDMFGES